jgi:hypothetical protein
LIVEPISKVWNAADDKHGGNIVMGEGTGRRGALDRIEERANSLRSIPRGTTGEGGIHRDDAVAEIFAPGSKKGAIERNTAALKKSGNIS